MISSPPGPDHRTSRSQLGHHATPFAPCPGLFGTGQQNVQIGDFGVVTQLLRHRPVWDVIVVLAGGAAPRCARLGLLSGSSAGWCHGVGKPGMNVLVAAWLMS